LKNKGDIAEIETANIFDLTDKVLDKKSDFAASLLYLALTDEANWVTPIYIEEGLKWISQ
jgi:putative ATP-dependent endonuclease of OLD family